MTYYDGGVGKEAVVFILDSYPTMMDPYRSATVLEEEFLGEELDEVGAPTRLSSAKKALESMVFDMVFNSQKGSLCTIIVTKTKQTKHHLVQQDSVSDESDVFPNLTEMCYDDFQNDFKPMRFPSAKMVREMWKVLPADDSCEEVDKLQGDIIDAILLGADALYKMTMNHNNKTPTPYKYRRKIVLLTDAGHELRIDGSQLLWVMDALRTMECPLHVLGMEFQQETIEYETMLSSEAAVRQTGGLFSSNKRFKRDPYYVSDDDDDDDDDDDQADVVPEFEDAPIYDTRRDREDLLASIAEKTGGSVASIHDMQELLDAKGGQRSKKVTGSQYQFHLGPGLTCWVKLFKMMQVRNPPTVRDFIEGSTNDDGEMDNVTRSYGYFRRLRPDEGGGDRADNDDDNNNGEDNEMDEDAQAEMINGIAHVEVDVDQVSDAIRYGKNLIPFEKIEKDGLKENFGVGFGYEDPSVKLKGKAYVHLVGCTNAKEIPSRYFLGPPYLLSGKDSIRSCTLVAAVARVLHELEFCAIVSMKTSKGIPSLAVLFPYEEEEEEEEGDYDNSTPSRLVLFKLPFMNEIKAVGGENGRGFSHRLKVAEQDEDENDTDSDSDDDKSTQAKAQAKMEEKEAKIRQRKEDLAAKEKASDALVDALMLNINSSTVLRSDKIRSPYLMSFHKNLQRRAVDKDAEGLVTAQERGEVDDKMMTPSSIVENAQPVIEEFRQTFPLNKKKIKKPAGGRKKKGPATYTDHLDD